MNRESEYLLSALKSFIHGERAESFDGDWSVLLSLAEIHSVTGILASVLMSEKNEQGGPYLDQLRVICLRTVGEYSQRAQRMKSLIIKMNDRGIDHLLFKGYVLKDYYPIPELRTFGDIDFLIRNEDREKSDDLMIQCGFERKTDWEPVYSYYKNLEFYEIHTDVMEVDVSEKADYKEYFSHTWERARLSDGHSYVLSPEDHLIYLLTHIAKHIRGSGAGIRMYMDIAVFLKHFDNQLDREYLTREFSKLRFEDFSNMVFSVVQRFFAVESPIPLREVDPQILNDFMNYTMEGGVFGHAGRDSGLNSLKNDDRDSDKVSRVSTLLHRVFPAAKNLEKRYTYLQNKPWLLPAAWVHRFIITRSSLGEHAKEAASIMNTDPDDVRKLRRIYKEIGL